MKKSPFLFTLMLAMAAVIPAGLFAEAGDITWKIGTGIGVIYGQSEEIVYVDLQSDDYLSQLLWDMKPLVYLGFNMEFDWESRDRMGYFAEASFKVGLPGITGVMEDRDWVGLVGGVWNSNWLTHYSVHDNKTNEAFLLDINAGSFMRFSNSFVFKYFLSYSWMHFLWTASGGSILYPKYPNGSEGHGYLLSNDDVISYTQDWHIVSLGASFYAEFNDHFNINLSLKLSPFVSVWAVDDHILRHLVVTDDLEKGLMAEPGLLFSFTSGFFSLSLSASYRGIIDTRGDAYYDYEPPATESDFYDTNGSGAGYSAWDVGLIASFKVL